MGHFPRSVTSASTLLLQPSTLFVCASCDHLFTQVELDLASYYAHDYDAALTADGFDELVAAADGTTSLRTDADYGMFRALTGEALHPRARVFEYGCGRGRILSRLKADGLESLYAYDVSERYRPTLVTIVGEDRLAIGPRPEWRSFDVACSFFALEHDDDPMGALEYLASLVKPGGLLYVAVPDYSSNLGDLACADHVNHFTSSTLSAAVEAAGFSVLRVDATTAVGTVAISAERVGPGALRRSLPRKAPGEARGRAAALLSHLRHLEATVSGLGRDTPVYLYGAGFYGTLASAYLASAGVTTRGIFDGNPKKHGQLRLGHAVASLESADATARRDGTLLVCVNPALAAGVAAGLKGQFASVLLA